MGFMKTEQEQIKAIKQIIDERVETTLGQVQGRHDNVIKTVDTVIIARDIINAGYGDVSEYKAEIERLKAENNELNKKNWLLEEELKKKEFEITYARNNGYEKGYDECEEYMKSKIKQAQIDVLNKAKERCDLVAEELEDEIDHYGSSAAYNCAYEIKKLIEEVQNGEDKG